MDFILENYTFLFQVISAFLALFVFVKYDKSKFLSWLTLLLLIVVMIEAIGAVLDELKVKGGWYIFHIYSFFEYNLITLMYLSIVKNTRSKQIIKVLILLLNVFYFSTYMFTSMQYWVTPIGSFVVSVYLFLYLNELLQANTVINYTKELPFWVTVGFFISYLPSIPFFSMLKNMKDRSLFYILEILVVMMNVFISIGLIIKLLENKKVDKNNIEIDNH